MNPVTPWIAVLADQCLSFYLGQNDQDDIQVEDFEGCLIFIIRRPTLNTAVVVSWGEGEDSHRATFTDSKNQIDAIILRGSPDAQKETSPCPPSVKGGPRHLVELSDIKLIFTYSASAPDVYLHVNRFTIHPNAVPKGDVPKPKLKKTPTLRTLMTMACEKIKKVQAQTGSNSQSDVGLTDSFVSQRDQPMPPHYSQHNTASQSLFSQPPSNMCHGAPKSNLTTNRVSINESSDLLGLLAPSRPIKKGGTATRELPEANELSLGERKSRRSPLPKGRKSVTPQEFETSPTRTQPSFRSLSGNTADATRASNSVTNVSFANLSEDVDNLIAECRSQAAQSPTEPDDHGRAHTVATGDNQQFSKKRNRGITDASPHEARDDKLDLQGLQNPHTSPSRKRQRVHTGKAMPADTTEAEQVQIKAMPSLSRVQIVSTKTDSVCPSTTNPWEGMIQIPLSEVDIPKDQAELLEGLKWIPQDPGVSAPLCHVPPHLLTQWNSIARRRQHLKEYPEEEAEGEEEEEEEEEQVSDRASTPTSQDIQTSPIPWSPSPNRTPARDYLPRDTASPPRYTRPIRKDPMPSGTQCSVDQSADHADMDMLNGSCSASSRPGQGGVVASKDNTKTAGRQYSQFPEKVTTKQINPVSLDHDPGDSPPQEHNTPTSLDVIDDQPLSVIIQEDFHDEKPTRKPPLTSELRDESSGDESDEPEMETYVPFALGGSLPLSSQPEHDFASSGLSLPRFAGSTIQVVETPAVHATRLNSGNQNKQRVGLEPQSSQHPSSQAAKTSSSSRILNTYRSQDSHGRSIPSQEAPNPSLPTSEGESLRVDVLGTQTQTSSVHAPSQATVQSSSDVVLDSSRPAQRQRGSSIFDLNTLDDPSSFPYARCHSLPLSQLHEPSQDFFGEHFSLDGAPNLPDLSPMEFTTWVAANGESPSRYPHSLRRGSADTSRKVFPSPNAELVARRRGFIGKSDKYAEAQTIYEKFCNDYSLYSGDFAHFIEMCSKLQTMRQGGQLQRSFLWDDFVIQHLEEYPRYFAERTSQDSKALDYEDFFCSKFPRPQHKKRSLTAHGVDIVASQFAPPTVEGAVTQDKAVQSEVAHTSLTASLVGESSTRHTRSLGDVPVPDVYMPTATQSLSPSTDTDSDSVKVKVEDDSSDGSTDSQIPTRSNDQQPVLFGLDEEIVNATQYDAKNTRIASDLNNVGVTDTSMDEVDDTEEGDSTHHETASIELGDDTDDRHISAFLTPPEPPAALGSLNGATIEPPRQRKPWFRSLRNIYPTGPVWSDDPDTPFKRWARHDQNVLLELNRRGGVRVLLDEKGVIRRPIYNHGNNPNF